MVTKLYSFYDLPFDHDVCHLYEHIVIQEFRDKLLDLGYSSAFYGSLHGETTDSTIFFSLGVRTREEELIFEEYLATPKHINSSAITLSLIHIEAEMKANIRIKEPEVLNKQLEMIDTIVTGSKFDSSKAGGLSPLLVTESPHDFRDVAILVNVLGISEDTQKAFLCLHTVLLDIIRDAAINEEAAYPVGTSPLAIHEVERGLGIGYRFTVKKSVDVAAVEKTTRKYLKHYDVTKYTKYLEEYRRSFAHDDWASTAPIRFYNDTGIKTTTEECARLATPERFAEIIDKTTIQIAPVTGKLKQIEWL